MILLLLVILVFITIVAAIVYNHHSMKSKWENATNIDVLFAREAIHNSVYASNTESELLALLEAQSAVTTIDLLNRRYSGANSTSNITGIDMQDAQTKIINQRDRIVQHLCDKYPNMLPRGELTRYTEYVRKRTESRKANVPHFDVKDSEFIE